MEKLTKLFHQPNIKLIHKGQVAQTVKNPHEMRETWVQYLGWQDPGGGHSNPLQYSCLQNPHGQRSLARYSPWGHKESDVTKWLSIAHYLQGYPQHIDSEDKDLNTKIQWQVTIPPQAFFYSPSSQERPAGIKQKGGIQRGGILAQVFFHLPRSRLHIPEQGGA